MQLKVRDWMINLVVYVEGSTLVTDALATMRRRYLDSLIVKPENEGEPFGIITSIDICDKIVAQGQNPSKTTVREVMHSPLITVNQNTSIQDCAALMKEKRIHHLPVVDERENLVGMIAATDFLVVAEALGRGNQERSLS
jgi:CBS domain-containing protein